ncbi:MAG: preprotein translocase subunit SecE [Candidatus Saccharimonadales bacterium]
MAKVIKKASEDSKKPKKTVASNATKPTPPKTKRSQTVRDRTKIGESGRKRRLRNTASKFKTPFAFARQTGKREYHMPLPDNRAGRILKKRVRLAPKFMREAGQEIKLVTWPNFRETIRLTMAVFIFAVIFASIVGVLDYGLDKLFREVIIKK